jgi:hypothetical protein
MKMSDQESLLPWYINKSLSASEQQGVETWLQHNPDSAARMHTTQRIAATITAQDLKKPSPRVESKLLARIRQSEKKPIGIQQWAWSLPLAALLFIILWVIVQPSTQLQWSVNGDNLAAFRVYRAPAGSTTFELLEELPAASDQTSYEFIDGTTTFPGRTYHYAIEIVAQNGSTAVSPVVSNNTLIALSSQFAILLTGFILTFGMITIVRELKTPIQL